MATKVYFHRMKVVATNIGERKTIRWGNKDITTGIFKYPVETGIVLGSEDVEGDTVVDRKHHGGLDKACYIFSADVYPEWKELYPDLEWSYGMFGENITIEGLDESNLFPGDQFKLGTALVEVSESRQPCLNLNVRFNAKDVIERFIEKERCGTYLRVIKKGEVRTGDEMILIQKANHEISILQIYQLIYKRSNDRELAREASELPALAITTRDKLKSVWKL